MNNEILSYKDWLKSEKGNAKLPNPYESYLEYVNSWYERSFNGKTTAELTADEYRNFLLTLKNVSSDEEIVSYINNLDYSNINEVQTAIPYFAKNLSKIASKIINYRVDATHTTTTDSFLNSNKGITLEIYKKLLGFHYSISQLSGEQFLNSVKGASVDVEELYDDNEYLDKQPELLANDYFSTSGTASFLEFDNSFIDWVIESGFNRLYSNNEVFNPETSAILPISGYVDYELSGISVNYYKGNLSDKFMGEGHYSISGDTAIEYSTASNPWNNLSNRYFPTLANLPLIDSIYNNREVGGFFIPSKLGMPVALGRNKFYNIGDISLSGIKLNHFPEGSVYSNGYTFTKTYQDSFLPYNSYLNWIDIKQNKGRGKGIIASDGKYQEMIPYQTSYESYKSAYLGMDRIGDKTDPWYLSEDKVWRDDESFPPDFRNIYNVAEWYATTTAGISGYQDQWGIDIYGNNYALYKNTNSDNIYNRIQNSSGKLYIRSIDGVIDNFQSYFEESIGTSVSGFEFNSLKYFNVYNDIIIMEDINNELLIQKVELSGSYQLDSTSIISTINFEPTGNFATLGHYFDDRTQTLYFGRYNETISDSLEFVIYKYDNGRIISIYDTSEDISNEMISLRSNYKFSSITNSPSILISPIHNKIFVTYIAHVSGSSKYIVIIPIIMEGGFEIDEITVVVPITPSAPIYSIKTTETLKLINTMISEDNLVLLLEGETTNGKYLQCIQL